MIFICEPQCLGVSHEKVNSAFLYGLRITFPEEKILFYSDESHIQAIKDILKHDNHIVENIEYFSINFSKSESFFAFFKYYFLFYKLFIDMLRAKTYKVFLLSFSIKILYIIKKLKQKPKFADIKITSVLHGEFENIADDKCERIQIQHFEKSESILSKIRKIKLRYLPKKCIQFFKNKTIDLVIKKCNSLTNNMFNYYLDYKKILLWKNSRDYKFIALSPHIKVNATKYIDLQLFNIYSIVLPTIFANLPTNPKNKYVKFAVLGFGYPAMLEKVLLYLSQKNINKNYEIWIIGMDDSGTKGFSNIHYCPNTGKGKQLSREEMERNILDIDIFLNLYDKNQYRLSCTNSIIEALSYIKPILHFDNDCINNFNRKERPIGIGCETIEQYVATMENIINNYDEYYSQLQLYKRNIIELRKSFAIENLVQELKNSFTW